MSTTVVLADEQPIARWAVGRLLQLELGTVTAAEAGDGLAAVQAVVEHAPDVLILELCLPGLNGWDVLARIGRQSPKTRAVAFTAVTAEDAIVRAVRNGASGYVVKTSDPTELVEAVRRAADGRYYLSSHLSERDVVSILAAAAVPADDPHDGLTPRERQVLQLVAEGGTGAGIAARLAISPRTVEMHRARAMHKLHLRNRTDLVRYAVRRGLIRAAE